MTLFMPRVRILRLYVAAACLLLLGACGFHLKGTTPLPFQSIYTNIDLDSEFGARLRRAIEASSPDTRLTDRRTEADVYLHQISDDQSLRQVSIDAEGRVEEYQLNLDFRFELLDRFGHVLLAPTTLHSIREIPYNERIVQAKESVICRNFASMRNDLVDRILRRISAPEVQAAYHNADERPIVPMPGDAIERSGQGTDRVQPRLFP